MPSVEVELEDILEEVRCECGEILQWDRARRFGRRMDGTIEIAPCECKYKRGEEVGYDRGYYEGHDDGYRSGYEEGRKSIYTKQSPPKSCLLF